jgi:hypothetical protein
MCKDWSTVYLRCTAQHARRIWAVGCRSLCVAHEHCSRNTGHITPCACDVACCCLSAVLLLLCQEHTPTQSYTSTLAHSSAVRSALQQVSLFPDLPLTPCRCCCCCLPPTSKPHTNQKQVPRRVLAGACVTRTRQALGPLWAAALPATVWATCSWTGPRCLMRTLTLSTLTTWLLPSRCGCLLGVG